MTIYEHTTSLTTVAGAISTVSLRIPGGLLKQVLVRANTATTSFRLDMQDENGVTRLNYGFHKGEMVDNTIGMPITGNYTLNITNASPDDTFRVILSVQEN